MDINFYSSSSAASLVTIFEAFVLISASLVTMFEAFVLMSASLVAMFEAFVLMSASLVAMFEAFVLMSASLVAIFEAFVLMSASLVTMFEAFVLMSASLLAMLVELVVGSVEPTLFDTAVSIDALVLMSATFVLTLFCRFVMLVWLTRIATSCSASVRAASWLAEPSINADGTAEYHATWRRVVESNLGIIFTYCCLFGHLTVR
jgi:hypothetical protein